MSGSAVSSPARAHNDPPIRPTRLPADDLHIFTDARILKRATTSVTSTGPGHVYVCTNHTDMLVRDRKGSNALSVVSSRKSRKKSIRGVIGKMFRHGSTNTMQKSPATSIHSISHPLPSPPTTFTQPFSVRRSHDDQPLYPDKDNGQNPTLPVFSTPFASPHALQSGAAPFMASHDSLLSRRSSLPSRAGPLIEQDYARANQANESSASKQHMHGLDVGMAITSGAETPNRRSRSVSGSRDPAEMLRTLRQLEDEKEYWRQSVPEAGLYRSNSDDSQGAESFQDAQSHLLHDPVESAADEEQEAEGRADRQEDYEEDNEDDDDETVETDARRYAAVVAAEAEEEAMMAEQEHRLLTAHDSPVMGPRQIQGLSDESLQIRLVKLEQMMSAFQQPLEALAKNKRKSVTFETVDSRHASRNPMPDDSRILFFLQLINDERAKRRSLERQVQSLRDELAEMRFQLSQPIMSRGSRSYMSGHVRQRQASSRQSKTSIAGLSIYDQQRLTSRFSQSESLTGSEAARMRRAELDDAQSQPGDEVISPPATPYEISTDPISRWKPRESGELDMF